MNPKFRPLYLTVGFTGLILLFYQIISTFSDIDPIRILEIAIPDMIFVFLAYRTYPPEPRIKTSRTFSQRKVSNY